MKAKYLTKDDVPEDVVANERRIAEETAREEGKPEQALPKIIEGRLTGFFKDVVLLEQPSLIRGQEDRQAGARRRRRDRDPVRPLRGRPALETTSRESPAPSGDPGARGLFASGRV